MAWLKREITQVGPGQKRSSPDGMWRRCEKCDEVILETDFVQNQNVCPNCDFHYYLPADDRIDRFLDPGTFEEYNADLTSPDPLSFKDTKPYSQRLAESQAKVGRQDAIVTGRGNLLGRPVHVGVFDFQFMGGSMGAVVGEKIARLYEKALAAKEPAIIFSASGGARMQEGIFSLMQMSKTCAVLSQLKVEGVPFISILTHPTTGGVAASFAMLGDINIAEPGALIGFAGPRVIQQTIKEKLPEGFQRSEYLLAHGMVDMICHRDTLRSRVAQILSMICQNI